MEHELNLLRLSKKKKERNEIKYLKSKYELYNLNRFSLTKEDQIKYKRNIKIINELVKLIPLNFKIPFNIYINNIKIERIRYSKYIFHLNKICNEKLIPEEIKDIIISFL